MERNTAKEVVRIRLTEAQQAQVHSATGRDGDVIELTVQELEERIAPRLAANHNEPFLTDR